MNGENEQRDPKEVVRAKKVRGHTLWLSKQTRLLIFSSLMLLVHSLYNLLYIL